MSTQVEKSDEMDPALAAQLQNLAALEGAWKTARTSTNPIGVFSARIKNASLGQSASGRLQVHYVLEVLSGTAAGTEIHKYDGMQSEKAIAMTQGQMRTVGIPVDSISPQELPAQLLKLQDKIVQVEGRQNGEYYNIFFRRGAATVTSATPAKSSGVFD